MSNLILSVNPKYMGDHRLELLDKLILSYVSTWEQKGRVCFAKDFFFAYLFGEKNETINFSILKLQELNLLHVVKSPGGRLLQTIDGAVPTENNTDNLDVFDGIY